MTASRAEGTRMNWEAYRSFRFMKVNVTVISGTYAMICVRLKQLLLNFRFDPGSVVREPLINASQTRMSSYGILFPLIWN